MEQEYPVKYVRCEREISGSFITYKLPRLMSLTEAVKFMKYKLGSEWQVISGCPTNPDN